MKSANRHREHYASKGSVAVGNEPPAQVSADLAQLASIVESSPDAIVVETLDGEIRSWNPGAEHLYGYLAEEVAGQPFDILIPDGQTAALPSIKEKLARNERIEQYDTVRKRKNGSLVQVSVSISPIKDASGTIVGIASIARDITDRKRDEEERDRLLAQIGELAAVSQRKAAELQAILDNMVDGVIVCDTAGHVSLANEAAARIVGMPKPARLRRLRDLPKMLNTRHLDGRPLRPEEMVLARALKGAVVRETDEIFTNPATGREVHIRMSGAPIRDEGGKIVAAVGVGRDVTELTELDRLKDEFISVAAHELKTPISIMKGFAQALLRMAEEMPLQQQRMLEAINRGSDRIDRVVQDLLDISKLHLGRLELAMEPIDMAELVAEVVDRMTLTTTKHNLRVVSAEAAVVLGDRDRLEQVLANLVDNAIKYSPNGGDVEVAVKLQGQDALVSVKDFGIGIPLDKQEDIFERFYRAHTGTHHDYGGMGVGLYISRQILARHGGSICFDSREGQGTTFFFSLPLNRASS